MTRLYCIRDARKAQLFVHIRGEYRALERAGDHRGREEEALIHGRKQAEIRADLLPQPRRGETVGAALDARRRAADIAADGRKPAAGVFDEAAHDHIRAHVGRLAALDKFAVAVIDHAQSVGLALLAKRDELPDLFHRKRRARGVALGALDGDELCLVRDGGADAVIVERPVRQQIDLPVGNAVFLQRAFGRADADDLLQRVIRRTDGAEQLVAGQQVCAERHRQGVRAAGDLRAHERRLRAECRGVDALQLFTPQIVVAIARGGGKARRVHAVLVHGTQDLCLIVFRRAVDGGKAVLQSR